MSEWKDISTWRKEPDAEALVWDGYNVSQATYDEFRDEWWVLVEYRVQPTHWMELPEPPLASSKPE